MSTFLCGCSSCSKVSPYISVDYSDINYPTVPPNSPTFISVISKDNKIKESVKIILCNECDHAHEIKYQAGNSIAAFQAISIKGDVKCLLSKKFNEILWKKL